MFIDLQCSYNIIIVNTRLILASLLNLYYNQASLCRGVSRTSHSDLYMYPYYLLSSAGRDSLMPATYYGIMYM